MNRPALVLFSCLALAACAEPDPDPVPMAEPAPLPPPPPPTDGPRLDTISVEGGPVAMEMVPYESPLGFPLPFTTRVPADFEAESLASGEGDAVRFQPDGADDYALHIFVPSDASMDEASFAEYAAALGATDQSEQLPDWARVRYSSLTDDAYFVTASLTRHADRPVIVSTRYPGDAADGMAPRFGYVIDRIRWTDTGRLLIDG
jgi:hypothetical protein